MKGFPRIAYAVAVTITLFVALSVSQIQQETNQGEKPDPAQTNVGRARTVPNPNSDIVITLKFAFDNGESMLVSQRDGGLIRIERGNQIIGFTPYLPQGSDGPVALRLYEIKTIAKGGKFIGEKMIEQNTFDVSQNPFDYKIDDLFSTIQLVETRNSPRPLQNVNLKGSEHAPIVGEECCVSCNGVRACACAVQASCGNCCVGSCC
jgi:hypothetical protein